MASQLPVPKSYDQLLGDMLSAYAAKLGLNDFNTGSAITGFFEVVALSTARASGDIFQILKDFSVDRATGSALQRLATENGIIPITAKPTTGAVTVIDTSFTKISTQIYAGTNPPNIGSISINVGNASQFPSSGSIYIGRGTPNIEGPLSYSTTPAQVGNYWTITLSTPTAKYHNVSETVILAQGGNRSVPINAIVTAPGVGSSAAIQYNVTNSAIVLDGETTVTGVTVTAQTPGSSGNIPIGTITSFATPPFSGATATNPLPFTNGTDTETDDSLRVRIKNALASTGLGTATAVQSALYGATASDSNDIIVATSLQNNTDGSVTVFIDDGTGYEETSTGVGIEFIVGSAIGGEQFFQLQTGGSQAPVAKAFLQTTLGAPFAIQGEDTLAVIVGDTTYQHTFSTSDFLSPNAATAYEITASINKDTTLGFQATTAGGGTYVVINAIAETEDNIQITTPINNQGRDAAVQMGFPSNLIETLRLYKNNIPLNKDGILASVRTQAQQLWSDTIANGDTLGISVDGTAEITYIILDTDFIATGLYPSVSSTNSLASWAQVLNNKITGITATIIGQTLEITSNLGASNRAQVVIDPSSTLVTKGMFSISTGLSTQGAASDYTLDRNTAQFELTSPLMVGDMLSAGTENTQGTIMSAVISGGSITFSSDAHLWILIDSPGTIIPTGVVSNTQLAVSKPSTNIVRYTSGVSSSFSNVLPGDYVIIWSAELPSADQIEGRVQAVTGTTLDILITAAEWATTPTTSGITFLDGFAVCRTNNVPQKFKIAAGTYTLDQIVQTLQPQTENLIFSVSNEEYLLANTTTLDTTGSVMLVTADAQGQLTNLPIAKVGKSETSLLAFYDSGDEQAQLPLFIHAPFSADSYADPIDSYVNSLTSSVSLSGRDPDELICFLQPYGSANDAQPYNENVQESAISGTSITVVDESNLRRVRGNVDRFYIGSPLNFGYADTAVVVLDNNPNGETFTIPFNRIALTNTTYAVNQYNFNAYDVESGPTISFSSTFPNFNFSNFKALMQAKKVLKPTPSMTAILYRAVPWGRSGEKITVAYVYPSAANSSIGSTVLVSTSVDITINLSSGNSISSSIDSTTQWNVTVTPNTPSSAIDQVTYTWTGTGTNPNLSLSGGEYVNISSQSGFNTSNDGTFSVSTVIPPTSTSFSVQVPTGTVTPQSNVLTGVNNAITFYQSSTSTASQIRAYVAANLSQYITATIVNDGGTNGSGIITLSTYEDSGFTYKNVQLSDGINWILSNDVSGSPQFVFKNPLSYYTDGPGGAWYTFNNGEQVVLVPTTMQQVDSLISVLAVSGFSTLGNINLVDRTQRLELTTQTIGSGGAIQVIGGTGNEYSTPILGAGELLDLTYMTASVNNIAGQGIASDQWFRLQAAQAQNKITGFSSNSSISVTGNYPTAGQSLIQMSGRTLTQRYFGKPRHHVRTENDTFRVEKQGSLVCISWTGVGTDPIFVKSSLNFNDSSGGTYNAAIVAGTSDVQFTILTGDANFTELSIGDLITISGLSATSNNGTFLVTGVSDNGITIQLTNPDAQNQYSSGTFTFTGNANAGDVFAIGATNLTAVASSPSTNQFLIGVDEDTTAVNLSAAISILPQVTSAANGNIVTVTGTYVGQSLTLSYTPSSSTEVTVGAFAGSSFSAGQFSASSGISEGDTVVMSAPFNVLNQGTFRVIREYNNSIWIENTNVVQEEVNLPYNPISLGFDGTTSFNINASNNSLYLNWNYGVGTQPHLENANMGDTITFGTDFSTGNQGSFMVLNSGAALNSISQLAMPTGAQLSPSGAGNYFEFWSAGNINPYYVWFNVNSGNSDPAPVGFTGIQVAVLSGDSSTSIAAKAALAITGVASSYVTPSASGSILTLSIIGDTATNDPINVTMPAPFSVTMIQEGQTTFLECIDPTAVNQASILITDILQCHRPQIQFSEYEATDIGDLFGIAGSVIGASNAGTYPVEQIKNRDSVIVTGALANATNVSLNGNETAIFVEEEIPYYGYKNTYLVSAEPGTTTNNEIVFNSSFQYPKINQAASVEMTSLGKLNFSTALLNGLDSYRYNTGLIAEANRIVYGDPRDPITYPGVGAAGADIFIRAPLAYRIQTALDIRLQTGAPFNTIAQQVRSNVSGVIQSNPVGKSIAIASIIGAAMAVPGVISVAISSPVYNITEDLITLVPSQKAIIVDPTIDISVSQIGS